MEAIEASKLKPKKGIISTRDADINRSKRSVSFADTYNLPLASVIEKCQKKIKIVAEDSSTADSRLFVRNKETEIEKTGVTWSLLNVRRANPISHTLLDFHNEYLKLAPVSLSVYRDLPLPGRFRHQSTMRCEKTCVLQEIDSATQSSESKFVLPLNVKKKLDEMKEKWSITPEDTPSPNFSPLPTPDESLLDAMLRAKREIELEKSKEYRREAKNCVPKKCEEFTRELSYHERSHEVVTSPCSYRRDNRKDEKRKCGERREDKRMKNDRSRRSSSCRSHSDENQRIKECENLRKSQIDKPDDNSQCRIQAYLESHSLHRSSTRNPTRSRGTFIRELNDSDNGQIFWNNFLSENVGDPENIENHSRWEYQLDDQVTYPSFSYGYDQSAHVNGINPVANQNETWEDVFGATNPPKRSRVSRFDQRTAI